MAEKSPYDGKRGLKVTDGWWVDPKEAKEYSVGKEKWWLKEGLGRKVVPLKQYDSAGPKKKPIWHYNNGDMYLGEWVFGPKGVPVEHGFGVLYNHRPEKFKGKLYIGDWKNGFCHGSGQSLWLNSSPTWKKNQYGGSEIKQKGGRKGLPYTYVGNYELDVRSDRHASVSLKDGTTRIGPWNEGNHIGDWWGDEHQPAAAAPAASSSEEDEAPPRKKSSGRPSFGQSPKTHETNKSGKKRSATASNNSKKPRRSKQASKGLQSVKVEKEPVEEEIIEVPSDDDGGTSMVTQFNTQDHAEAPLPSNDALKEVIRNKLDEARKKLDEAKADVKRFTKALEALEE